MCLVYLGGYGLGRFFVEGLRTDQLLIPHTQIAVSQVLAIVMFVFAVALNAYIRFYLAKDLKKETPS